MIFSKIKPVLLFFIATLLFSCQNDDTSSHDMNNNPTLRDEQFKQDYFGEQTTGNFFGFIKDEDRNPLENVQVEIGNKSTVTDRNGMFIIRDADVFENHAYVKASKQGYLNGSRVVIPKSDGSNRIDIMLLSLEASISNITTVNSGEISEVSSVRSKITFSGDFVTSDGETYQGQVEVYQHYAYPTALRTFELMPGSLFAQTENNDARTLETFGMVAVELRTPSGEPLNISDEQPAEIEFDIDNSQLDTAPENIELWYFDEEVGYWKEEGLATRVGNTYVGEVTHFSWWNIDLPIEYVELCFDLLPNNIPQNKPYNVLITNTDIDQIIFNGILNPKEGPECGLIPKDEEIVIRVYGVDESCDTLIHEETSGPFSTDSSVDVSFTDNTLNTTITGTVTDCSGSPLSNGYLFISSNNSFDISNGMIDFAVETCSNTNLDVQIFDFDTNQFTTVYDVNFTGSTVDLGSLSTCEDSGGIYNGDVLLDSQDDVDNFGLFNYVKINGYLHIRPDVAANPDAQFTNITDLSPLSSLETVTGTLQIRGNELLPNLNGLNNLTEILGGASTSSLFIFNNDLLTSLNELQSLTTAERVTIRNNANLASLQGLENLSEIDDLRIQQNPNLINLNGVESITALEYLEVGGNDNLESLEGLNNLNTVTPSSFSFPPEILIGYLTTADFNDLPIAPNPNLTNFCAIENLINNLNSEVEVLIENNGYNPSLQDFADGNCSQ